MQDLNGSPTFGHRALIGRDSEEVAALAAQVVGAPGLARGIFISRGMCFEQCT